MLSFVSKFLFSSAVTSSISTPGMCKNPNWFNIIWKIFCSSVGILLEMCDKGTVVDLCSPHSRKVWRHSVVTMVATEQHLFRPRLCQSFFSAQIWLWTVPKLQQASQWWNWHFSWKEESTRCFLLAVGNGTLSPS